MKRFTQISAVVGVLALLSGYAYAGYCNTDCWTDMSGNQHCTTTCY